MRSPAMRKSFQSVGAAHLGRPHLIRHSFAVPPFPTGGLRKDRAAKSPKDSVLAWETELILQICREGQFRPDFPCTELSTEEDLTRVLSKAPRVLFRGLTQEQAVQLRARFPYPARVTIHEDPNGSTPVEKLIQPSGKSSAEAARASGSSQESGGMTFGGTVGAVIVGVIAAVLILSFL